MVSRGRHPKLPVAKALAEAITAGLEVEEVHRGHRWGVVICPRCRGRLGVWSTPRVPEDLARSIGRFSREHRRCQGSGLGHGEERR